MQKHEIIIKKILTRLLEQRYTSGKDMPLEELWSNNINKEEYNRVKNFLLPDDAKHLVGICAPRNEPVRITITAQGVAYLERLEQKEANETMRDIQKATAKTQIFMVAATSILAFFSMVEILQKQLHSNRFTWQ